MVIGGLQSRLLKRNGLGVLPSRNNIALGGGGLFFAPKSCLIKRSYEEEILLRS